MACLKFLDIDPRELICEELKLATEVVDLEKMDKKDRANFLHEINLLYNNSFLDKIINSVIVVQKEETLEKAVTEKQLLCGRSSIHGAMAVREEIQRYNQIFESEQVKEEKEDKHSIISNFAS